MKKIVVLCGESASGKTFIQNILTNQLGFHTMISVTTRPKRTGEIEGYDYYFIKDSVFDKLVDDNDLLESRTYSTIQDGKPCIWRYGLEKSEVKDDVVNIVVTDLEGMKELKEQFEKENKNKTEGFSIEKLVAERKEENKDFFVLRDLKKNEIDVEEKTEHSFFQR